MLRTRGRESGLVQALAHCEPAAVARTPWTPHTLSGLRPGREPSSAHGAPLPRAVSAQSISHRGRTERGAAPKPLARPERTALLARSPSARTYGRTPVFSPTRGRDKHGAPDAPTCRARRPEHGGGEAPASGRRLRAGAALAAGPPSRLFSPPGLRRASAPLRVRPPDAPCPSGSPAAAARVHWKTRREQSAGNGPRANLAGRRSSLGKANPAEPSLPAPAPDAGRAPTAPNFQRAPSPGEPPPGTPNRPHPGNGGCRGRGWGRWGPRPPTPREGRLPRRGVGACGTPARPHPPPERAVTGGTAPPGPRAQQVEAGSRHPTPPACQLLGVGAGVRERSPRPARPPALASVRPRGSAAAAPQRVGEGSGSGPRAPRPPAPTALLTWRRPSPPAALPAAAAAGRRRRVGTGFLCSLAGPGGLLPRTAAPESVRSARRPCPRELRAVRTCDPVSPAGERMVRAPGAPRHPVRSPGVRRGARAHGATRTGARCPAPSGDPGPAERCGRRPSGRPRSHAERGRAGREEPAGSGRI
ncbi:translation initiation factor IF-2-like [Lutra lutra]|uniref:translation initiation factor IF-2-like n=1 Tax=Lutra lutra TaxID=9657 RepID=UPI001FD43EE8|nr:translation initiation factor IF-2-like [Lutra lutra]